MKIRGESRDIYIILKSKSSFVAKELKNYIAMSSQFSSNIWCDKALKFPYA